ncbi:hypothetical protein [Paenibacillus sp. P32E]|uniref:hypothetical protein n=1 Tax=Paenibacillus sp. P32E TaxID=1349434 RepID=UPI00093E163E|nr:hypothetical protein [Paenibacillus sp. P32E]OKP90188.1 hypothetical protein A3848_12575 [Paenibacillus sp. P32E]
MKPVREVFELQALEIIYLTALTGGNSFPGLAMNLEGESEIKQRSLMDAQMRALEAKGYLEIDFMGIAKVNEVLHRFIVAASNCKSYLCQLVQRNQEISKICYFIQDESRFELKHQSGSNTYKLQEIYARHELMFQVIDSIPLIQNLAEDEQSQTVMNGEVDLESWTGQLLQAGAVVTSLAEIQCISEKAQVIRELNLLIYEDQMWLLRRGSDEQISRTSATLSTAVEELCLWLQEA